jgi:hypothetical protein
MTFNVGVTLKFPTYLRAGHWVITSAKLTFKHLLEFAFTPINQQFGS